MNNVDKQYLDILQDILDNGTYKKTRAGYVKSVFGRQMRFNLKEGLPLLTTKKVYVKGIIHELLFFLSGKCNINYLKDNNVHIWDGDCERWDKESGIFMGKLYPHQWRRYGASKMICDKDTERFYFKINELIDSDSDIFKSNYGDYKKISKNGSKTTIQFLYSGYIKEYRNDKIKNNNLYDPYFPSIHNMCCFGVPNKEIKEWKKLYIIWKGIVDRCYNENNDNYSYYGGKGVRLSKRWKCFEFFLNDAIQLKNWEEKCKNWRKYQIDKDIHGNGFLYSKSTCEWVYINDNMKKSKEKYLYTVSNGRQNLSFINVCDFIAENGIKNQGNFCSMLRGERETCEGWYFVEKKLLENNGFDQIRNIINTLKTSPDDRRMLCMAWNVNDLNEMALPPCHYGFQVYTRELTPTERLEWLWEHSNGEYDEWKSPTKSSLDDLNVPTRELSLMFNMRSNDFCCGNPYNIAQYGMLAYMFCEVCNMVPGELIYNGGDVHVYENHIEAAKEQLSRNGSDKIPTLRFARKINDIDDFKYEDFIIENYEPDASIKYELNVG